MTYNSIDKQVQIIDLIAEKNKFACKSCNLSFASLNDLNTHHLSNHKDWKLTCPECSEGFSNLIDFCAHKKSHGNNTNTGIKGLNHFVKTFHNFSCKECSEHFPNPLLFQVHMKNFHSKTAIEGSSTITNVSNVVSEPTYPCKVCGESFSQYKELYQHVSQGHPGVSSHPKRPEPKFQCEYCPKKFVSRIGLKDHINGKHKGIRFNCRICDTSMSTKRDLRRHLRKKHSLSTEDELRDNVLMSGAVKMVGISESRQPEIESTNRAENDPLDIGMRSSEEPYVIMDNFEEEIDAKIDIKHHSILEEHGPEIDTFGNTIQKKDTKLDNDLVDSKDFTKIKVKKDELGIKIHQKQVSGPDSFQVDSKKLLCKSCNIVFASKVILGMHMDISHSQNTFECIHCQIVFSTKQELFDHDCEM